jgi:transcriptional regulator with XRE-family HTH domain
MSTLLGLEDDMDKQDGRDYGHEAILRRLGSLARRRREEMGFSRAALVEHSGIRSDATIRDFEFGKFAPRELTQTRLEKALGWRSGIIGELLSDENRAASTIQMEDVDQYDSPTADPMAQIPTGQLLQEVIRRLSVILDGLNVQGQHVLSQEMLGLAAMGHKPEHLDDDGDDDISAFGPSAN